MPMGHGRDQRGDELAVYYDVIIAQAILRYHSYYNDVR